MSVCLSANDKALKCKISAKYASQMWLQFTFSINRCIILFQNACLTMKGPQQILRVGKYFLEWWSSLEFSIYLVHQQLNQSTFFLTDEEEFPTFQYHAQHHRLNMLLWYLCLQCLYLPHFFQLVLVTKSLQDQWCNLFISQTHMCVAEYYW